MASSHLLSDDVLRRASLLVNPLIPKPDPYGAFTPPATPTTPSEPPQQPATLIQSALKDIEISGPQELPTVVADKRFLDAPKEEKLAFIDNVIENHVRPIEDEAVRNTEFQKVSTLREQVERETNWFKDTGARLYTGSADIASAVNVTPWRLQQQIGSLVKQAGQYVSDGFEARRNASEVVAPRRNSRGVVTSGVVKRTIPALPEWLVNAGSIVGAGVEGMGDAVEQAGKQPADSYERAFVDQNQAFKEANTNLFAQPGDTYAIQKPVEGTVAMLLDATPGTVAPLVAGVFGGPAAMLATVATLNYAPSYRETKRMLDNDPKYAGLDDDQKSNFAFMRASTNTAAEVAIVRGFMGLDTLAGQAVRGFMARKAGTTFTDKALASKGADNFMTTGKAPAYGGADEVNAVRTIGQMMDNLGHTPVAGGWAKNTVAALGSRKTVTGAFSEMAEESTVLLTQWGTDTLMGIDRGGVDQLFHELKDVNIAAAVFSVALGAPMRGARGANVAKGRKTMLDYADKVLAEDSKSALQKYSSDNFDPAGPGSVERSALSEHLVDRANWIKAELGVTEGVDMDRASRFATMFDIQAELSEKILGVRAQFNREWDALKSARELAGTAAETIGGSAVESAKKYSDAMEQQLENKINTALQALVETDPSLPLANKRLMIAAFGKGELAHVAYADETSIDLIHQGLFDAAGNPRSAEDPLALTDLSPEGVTAFLAKQVDGAATDVAALGKAPEGVSNLTTPTAPSTPTPTGQAAPPTTSEVSLESGVSPTSETTPATAPTEPISELTSDPRRSVIVNYQGVTGTLSVSPDNQLVLTPAANQTVQEEVVIGPAMDGERTLQDVEGLDFVKFGRVPRTKEPLTKPDNTNPATPDTNLLDEQEQTTLDQAWDRINNTETYYPTSAQDIETVRSLIGTARSRVPATLNPGEQLKATEQFDSLEASLRSVEEFFLESRTDGNGQQTFGFDAPVDSQPTTTSPAPAPVDTTLAEGQLELAPRYTPEQIERATALQRNFINNPAQRAAVTQRLIEQGETPEAVEQYFANIEAIVTENDKRTNRGSAPETIPANPTRGTAANRTTNQAGAGSSVEGETSSEEGGGTGTSELPQRSLVDNFRSSLTAALLAEKPAELTEAEWLAGNKGQLDRAVAKAGAMYNAIMRGETAYRAGNPEAIVDQMLSGAEKVAIIPARDGADPLAAKGTPSKKTLLGAMMENFRNTGSFLHTFQKSTDPATGKRSKTNKVVPWAGMRGHGFANDWAKQEAQRADANLDGRSFDTLVDSNRDGQGESNSSELPPTATDLQRTDEDAPPVIHTSFETRKDRIRAIDDTRGLMEDTVIRVAANVRNRIAKETPQSGHTDLDLYMASEGAVRALLTEFFGTSLGMDANTLLGDSDAINEARAKNPVLFRTIQKSLEGRAPEITKEFIDTFKGNVPDSLKRSVRLNASAATLANENLVGLETFMLNAASYAGTVTEQIEAARDSGDVPTLLGLQLQITRGDQGTKAIITSVVNKAMKDAGVSPENLTELRNWFARMTPETLMELEQDPALPDELRQVNAAIREIAGEDAMAFLANQNLYAPAQLIAQLTQSGPSFATATPSRLVLNWALPETLIQGSSAIVGRERLLHVSLGTLLGDSTTTGAELFTTTILHEAVHGKLSDRLSAYLDPSRRDSLEPRVRESFGILEDVMLESREAAVKFIMDRDGVDEATARQTLETDRDFRGVATGAGLGLNEYLNEALNHKPFQEFLSNLTTDVEGRSSTVWQRIVNLISRLIMGRDIAMDSTFQRTLEEGLKLMSDSQSFSDQAMQRTFLEGSTMLDYEGRTLAEMEGDPDFLPYFVAKAAEFRDLRAGNREAGDMRDWQMAPKVPDARLVEPLADAAAANELSKEAQFSVTTHINKVRGKSVRDTLQVAVAEAPASEYFQPEDFNGAFTHLTTLVQNPASAGISARGKRVVNLNAPDDATARKQEAARPNERWDGTRQQLRARAIHAVTKDDRVTPSPDKIVSARLVPQTLRQADIVAERDMIVGEGKIPMWVFAKLYTDPSSPSGERWHFVEVRKNGGLFETQYSDTNPTSGRALLASVVGLGESASNKKKSDSQVGYEQATVEGVNPQRSPAIEPLPESQTADSQVGYGQADFGIAISPNPQAIEPLPESQTATLDNASAQNVQEKILEQLDSLIEKRDRLKAAGDNIGAMVVSDQIKALEVEYDAVSLSAPVDQNFVVSQENILGSRSGLLERLADAPANTKQEFHTAINQAILDPETGRDVVAEMLGLPNPTVSASGTSVYVRPDGKAEVNPVDTIGGFRSAEEAKAYAIVRGALTAQNAVAGVQRNPNGEKAALLFETGTPPDANTIEQITKAIVKPDDTAFYIQPTGFLLVRLGFDKNHTETAFAETASAVASNVNKQPVVTRADTFYYENDFDKPTPETDEYGLGFTNGLQSVLASWGGDSTSGPPVLQGSELANRASSRIAEVVADFSRRGYGQAGSVKSSLLGLQTLQSQATTTPESRAYEALTGEPMPPGSVAFSDSTTQQTDQFSLSPSVATPVEVSRFQELTKDLQGRELTQADVDQWKQANPEAYAELEGMREAVLKRAGFTVEGWHSGKAGDRFSIPSPLGKMYAWFTPDENYAKQMGERHAVASLPGSSSVRKMLLNAGNTLDATELQDYTHTRKGLSEFLRTRGVDFSPEQFDFSDLGGGKSFYEVLAQDDGVVKSALEQAGFSAVRLFESMDTLTERLAAESVAVFNPEQIKSADPLNLEDGKLITPDQWADSESADIRFSAPTTAKQSAAVAYADKLGTLSKDELDNVEFNENRMGYSLWEARNLARKIPTNSTKFKKVTDNNSNTLSDYYKYIANVDGVPFGITEQEDPDAEDLIVYAFEPINGAWNDQVETVWGKGAEAEVVKEMQEYLAGNTSFSAPTTGFNNPFTPPPTHASFIGGPGVANRDSAKYTRALERIRTSPDFGDVARALQGKQYIPDSAAGLNEAASNYIDGWFAATPNASTSDPLAYSDLYNYVSRATDLQPGVKIIAKANIAKRIRIARDALVAAQPTNNPASIKIVTDLFNQQLDGMLADIAEQGSAAGSELNYMRMVSQLFEPTHWVRLYTQPSVKVRNEVLGASPAVAAIQKALNQSHTEGSKNTYNRMLKVLELAGRRFLPAEATERSVRASANFAKSLSDMRSGTMTNVEIVQHATELLVAQIHDNTLRKFEGVPNSTDKQAAVASIEERARELAKQQLDGILAARLQGGTVDEGAAEPETNEQKLERFWNEIADTTRVDPLMGLAEIIFNQVMMEGQDANTPYSGLFANDPSNFNSDYKFDTEGATLIRKAVVNSVSMSEEIRKSLADRSLTEQGLIRSLRESVPDLSEDQVTKIANAVVSVYRAEVSKQAEVALNRLLTNATKEKTEISLELIKTLGQRKEIGKLLKIINMGAFKREDVYNALAESYGLPTYRPEVAEKIMQMAEDMQKLSVDSVQRGEAAATLSLEILKEINADAKGMDKFAAWNKVAGLVWQAGALQGLRTQAVNVVASTMAVQMENTFSAVGTAWYLRRQGVSNADAWGTVFDIIGGIRRTFGTNLEGTGTRAFDDAWSALYKGMSRFKTDKLESLSELEAWKAEPAVREQGKNFMEAWKTAGVGNRLGNVAIEGAKLGAAYAVSYPKNATLAFLNALQGKGDMAKADVARMRDNFLAERKMVGRFMIASDAVTSGMGVNSKLLMMRRAGELLGTEGIADKAMDTIIAEARAVVAKEEAEGQFGTKGTTEHDNLRARRLEQLVERGMLGGDQARVDLAREHGAKGTFNGDAYGLVGFTAMTYSRFMMQFGVFGGVQLGSFMRTLSNIINYSLELSPYGFLRAQNEGKGIVSQLVLRKGGSKEFLDNFKSYKKGSPEYYAAQVRAGVGTVIWGSLAALVMAGFRERERDEEPYIRVFGEGHPDFRIRKARVEAGIEKPFHIKIGRGDDATWVSYKDLPGVFFPLTLAGTVSDYTFNGAYEPEEANSLLVNAMLSGAFVTLDRNMMSGLADLLDIVNPTNTAVERERKVRAFAKSSVGPIINPGMVRMVEELVLQTKMDTSSTWGAAAAGTLPFGAAAAGEQLRNVLSEPVENPVLDILAGRFVSAGRFHPVLGPLAQANLIIPAPRREVVADEAQRDGVRSPTAEETRAYNLAYGEKLKELLTPAEVERMVGMAAKDRVQFGNAQERLSKLGSRAADHAWRTLRDKQGVDKGNKERHIRRNRAWPWQTVTDE
jgi:hypothetical protein